MLNKIKKHLEIANKSYFEHMFFAMKIGLKCLWSFVTAFVHAINPAGLNTQQVEELSEWMIYFKNQKTILKNKISLIG